MHAHTHIHTYIHTHAHTCIHTHIYVYVWTIFGCTPVIFPSEAKEGWWDYWSQATTNMEPYMKDV